MITLGRIDTTLITHTMTNAFRTSLPDHGLACGNHTPRNRSVVMMSTVPVEIFVNREIMGKMILHGASGYSQSWLFNSSGTYGTNMIEQKKSVTAKCSMRCLYVENSLVRAKQMTVMTSALMTIPMPAKTAVEIPISVPNGMGG